MRWIRVHVRHSAQDSRPVPLLLGHIPYGVYDTTPGHSRRFGPGRTVNGTGAAPHPEVASSPGELLRPGQEQEEVGRAGWRNGRHSQASRREADSGSPWRSVVGVVARSRRTTIGGRRETAIPWDPGEYLRFGDERTRPAVDLATRIAVESPRAVIDMGCGPGNSTQVLRQRWPRARISGLDSSAPMIARARRSYPDQEWVLGDLATWDAGAPYDVVFSNAALQWAHDHASLIRRLFSKVAPGGRWPSRSPVATIRRCVLACTRPRGTKHGLLGWRELERLSPRKPRLSTTMLLRRRRAPSRWGRRSTAM